MTTSPNPFGQVLVALITPFHADGEVDWAATEKHIDDCISRGADGIVVTFGVTAELRALDLKSGKLLWKHDLRSEMHVPQDFFGAGGRFGWLWLNHRAGAFGRGGGRGDSRTNRIMGLCHLPC